MQDIKEAFKADWPNLDGTEQNFSFKVIHPDGVFTFEFRYFNDRWNAWGTTPAGETRPIGVVPNVPSWSGFLDYGIVFDTSLAEIGKTSLKLTSLIILTWE